MWSASLLAEPCVVVVTCVCVLLWAPGRCEPGRQCRNNGDKSILDGRVQVRVVTDPYPDGYNDRVDNAAAIPDDKDDCKDSALYEQLPPKGSPEPMVGSQAPESVCPLYPLSHSGCDGPHSPPHQRHYSQQQCCQLKSIKCLNCTENKSKIALLSHVGRVKWVVNWPIEGAKLMTCHAYVAGWADLFDSVTCLSTSTNIS